MEQKKEFSVKQSTARLTKLVCDKSSSQPSTNRRLFFSRLVASVDR